MAYSNQFKYEIIAEYNLGINTSLEKFVKEKGVGKSTFYKWLRESNKESFEFIDITDSMLCEEDEVKPTLNVVINGAYIQVDNSYNEELLIRVARSLQKL